MSRRPILTVARREFVTRMVTKSNIISLAVMVGLILALGVVGKIFLTDEAAEPEAMQLAVDPSLTQLAEHLEASPAAGPGGVDVAELDEAAARAALTDPEAAPRIEAWVGGDLAAPRVLFEEDPDPQVLTLVEQAARDAHVADLVTRLGGDPATVSGALAPITVAVDQVVAPDDDFDPAQWVMATIVISLLLFALIGSGSMIAMGVVEEKTSRVVELLLSTIRPGQLLAGKILGIGAYGLFQIAVLGGALVAVVGGLGLFPDVPLNLGGTFALMVAWFLLGFGIYALLFGGFAALVSRQEDIGAVTTPLLFGLFVPFYLTLFLVPAQPDSLTTKVLSQIPFFAPFMMPTRGAMGVLEAWEMPLALLITGVTIPALVWISARVYRRAVLHTGGRMKLTEALRG